MPFTGDLENLHIADIIQLLHSTRKSGTFSVRGQRGESRIIFSNGYIVGANHLNNRVRIGTVLVKTNALLQEDLEAGISAQKEAGKDRKPLLTTLIEMGRISQEEAFKGLKKLIEITIVELIEWTEGAFTFDTEAISVSPDCKYIPGKMDQELSLDAQMVLMDTLRIYDERKRDSESGKDVPSDVELYGEDAPQEEVPAAEKDSALLTADDLGLSDVDKLEKKMPKAFSIQEIFDPIEIHRQHMREVLPDFSKDEQEVLVKYLAKSAGNGGTKGAARQEGQSRALIFFSRDALIKYAFLTIYKNEGVLVFATDEEEELDQIMAHCLLKDIIPVIVYDTPDRLEEGITEERILNLRDQVKERYPLATNIQLASPIDYVFSLRSYSDGVRAAFPKPEKDARKKTFIEDTIQFLNAFKFYVVNLLHEKKGSGPSAHTEGEGEKI